jgi:phage terminase large subunit
MKPRIDLRKLSKLTNSKFYPLYKCTTRWLILYGGAGSGKSKFAAQKIIFRMLTERPHLFLILRKRAVTLRSSVFADLVGCINRWGLQPLFRVTTSPMEITAANGNKIIFRGLDDPEKIKSITGTDADLTGIWAEETSEFEEKDIDQLNLRLRGRSRNYKQFILTFNPISETHWLKRRFFDIERPNATINHSTYLDNRFIDDEYRAELDALKQANPQYYDVYALGKWGSLGDVVYSRYKVSPDVSNDWGNYEKLVIGLDFGWNDPHALVCAGVRGKSLFVFRELYLKHTTIPELIREMERAEIPKNQRIIADSQNPGAIQELRNAGFWVDGAKKGKDSVLEGIRFLQEYEIMIHPYCTAFAKEISMYSWRKDKDGKPIDEPVGINDHTLDALRYAMEPLRLETGSMWTMERPW